MQRSIGSGFEDRVAEVVDRRVREMLRDGLMSSDVSPRSVLVDRLRPDTVSGSVLTSVGTEPGLVEWSAPGSYCKVYKSGNQSLAAGAWTSITYDTEKVDGEGMHSTSSQTERVTCVTPGVYMVSVHSMWAATTTGISIAHRVYHFNSSGVSLSGSNGVIYGETYSNAKASSSYDNMYGSTLVVMDAGDFLVHQMYCNLAHNAFGGLEGYTYLSAVRVAAKL